MTSPYNPNQSQPDDPYSLQYGQSYPPVGQPQGQYPPQDQYQATQGVQSPVYGLPAVPYVYVNPTEKNGMGIAALVLGISSFFCTSVVGAVLAIIFGHMNMKAAERGQATNGSFGKAGFILGIIGGVVSILIIIVYIIVLAVGAAHNGYDYYNYY